MTGFSFNLLEMTRREPGLDIFITNFHLKEKGNFLLTFPPHFCSIFGVFKLILIILNLLILAGSAGLSTGGYPDSRHKEFRNELISLGFLNRSAGCVH